MRIVVLGPPGAGKGTQAERLADDCGVPLISTGDILRDEAASGSGIGERIERRMAEGRLVPADLVTDLVRQRIDRPEARSRGFVLDGYPRTMDEARALDDALSDRDTALDLVLLLEAEREVLIDRLSGRIRCTRCGAVYHERLNPPPGGRCSRCGNTEFEKRDDDRPEAVERRLDEYRRQTEPVVDHYREAGLLRRVDASGDIEHVWNRTRRQVDARS